MNLSRRFRPALVAHTALATTLLAVTAAGDSVPLPDRAEAVQRPDDAPGSAGTDDRAVAPDQSGRGPSGTSPSLLSPGSVPDARLADALAPLLGGTARVSAMVQPLDGGEGAAFGEELFDTASIVKVDVLAALLLQAQDAGRTLTAAERAQAEIMIEQSDNDATDALWVAIGGAAGLEAANRRLGLASTTPGDGGHWGLTQTTSKDQITLLRMIFGERSVLSTESRLFIRELMGGVVEGQRWGISAAADGGAFELKNGWLPRSGTERWDVNSIGRVTAGGRDYLVAVVSDGHASLDAGVSAVETAARAAVASVSEPAGRGQRPDA